MIIDGHAHLWQPSQGFDIKPVRDHAAFRRDFLIPELIRWCDLCGIDRVVITQSAPQEAETEFLLATCRDEPRIAGVTGWVDLAAPDVGLVLDRLMEEPKFVGIRAQLRRVADDSFIERPEVRHGLAAVAARGLSVVLLAEARHLSGCLRLLEAEPALSAVLNHGGMPDLVNGDIASWRKAMTDYARRTSAAVQLSGFVTLAGPGWTPALLELVIAHLLDCFGPDRLMFASDWPMTDLHASYQRWWEVFNVTIDHYGLSSSERASVYGAVARRVHALDAPGRLWPNQSSGRKEKAGRAP